MPEPTKNQIDEFFVRGRKIRLPDGGLGMFLEVGKNNKNMAWVLTNAGVGGKISVSLRAITDCNKLAITGDMLP